MQYKALMSHFKTDVLTLNPQEDEMENQDPNSTNAHQQRILCSEE